MNERKIRSDFSSQHCNLKISCWIYSKNQIQQVPDVADYGKRSDGISTLKWWSWWLSWNITEFGDIAEGGPEVGGVGEEFVGEETKIELSGGRGMDDLHEKKTARLDIKTWSVGLTAAVSTGLFWNLIILYMEFSKIW